MFETKVNRLHILFSFALHNKIDIFISNQEPATWNPKHHSISRSYFL